MRAVSPPRARSRRAPRGGVRITVALSLVLASQAGAGGALLGVRSALAAPPSGTSLPPPSDAATDLALADKYYANMDYLRANLMAARVLAIQGLKHSELVGAVRLLALTDASLGHAEQAREEFIEVLTYAADFQVDPNLGPRVTAPFLEARGFWRAQPERPGIEIAVTVHADGPGTLRVTTRDPTRIVKSGSVGFRWGSSVPFAKFPLAVSGSGDGVVFDVPERPANLSRLDYYAQVVDERGDIVMEVGNPTAPKSAIVDVPKAAAAAATASHDQEKKTSIVASPIFWTVVGVVVAGAAVTTYFLTRPKDPTGANLSGATLCGSSDSMGSPPSACK